MGIFLHLKIFFIFFKMNIFLIPSSFLFFLKNYYHSTKGMEPAQSPKPAVSLSLNPSFLGHGSGFCPKNLLFSKVNSVNYEQFCVFFLHLKFFFIFFKMNIFLIPSSFLFFLKNYYHFTKDRTPLKVRRPRFPFLKPYLPWPRLRTLS